MEKAKDASYIQERLGSLHEIDTRIVSLLGNLSSTLGSLKEGKQSGSQTQSQEFKTAVSKFYGDLGYTAVSLRKEIRTLDHRISSNLSNSNLLPIQINKKATWVNAYKMEEEVSELNRLLGSDGTDDSASIDDEPDKDNSDNDDAMAGGDDEELFGPGGKTGEDGEGAQDEPQGTVQSEVTVKVEESEQKSADEGKETTKEQEPEVPTNVPTVDDRSESDTVKQEPMGTNNEFEEKDSNFKVEDLDLDDIEMGDI